MRETGWKKSLTKLVFFHMSFEHQTYCQSKLNRIKLFRAFFSGLVYVYSLSRSAKYRISGMVFRVCGTWMKMNRQIVTGKNKRRKNQRNSHKYFVVLCSRGAHHSRFEQRSLVTFGNSMLISKSCRLVVFSVLRPICVT